MENTITFHAIIEVLGKPEAHISEMIQNMVKKMGTDKNITLKEQEIAPTKKQADAELWSTFAEVEIECASVKNITEFCFDYMPSSVQIAKPATLELSAGDFTDYLNDLQGKLHQVDMIAKQMKMKHDIAAQNNAKLLTNYITVLLSKNKLTLAQLSQFTGVPEDKLGDYLDKLIDAKKVDLEGEFYTRAVNQK